MKKWSNDDIKYLTSNYGKVSLVHISKHIGRTYNATRAKALRLDLHEKDVVNAEWRFFDVWSEELAYVIGFFLADGDITDPNKHKRYAVRINSTDKDIIDKIVCISGYTGSVSEYRKTSLNKTIYRITFSGYKIWKFFNSLGFDNKKSKTAVFPKDIPICLMNHFIRGIFDGDGSIRLKHTMYPTMDITGTKPVVSSIGSIFECYSELFKCKNAKNTWRIVYHAENALSFLRYLYNNSTIYMQRKYLLYKKAGRWERQKQIWTETELGFITDNYKKMSLAEIGTNLGRSAASVYSKADQLGLKKFTWRYK